MHEEHSNQPTTVSPDASVLISEDRQKFRRGVRRVGILVVLIVVIAHLLVGLVAGIWVVARYFEKPKAQFTAVKVPPEQQKHQIPTEEVASLRPKPVLNNRIQSLKPSALVLPDLPKVPVDTAVPIDTSVASTQLGGTGNATTGTGAGGTGEGFFGGGKVSSGLLEGTLYDLKQTSDGKQAVKVELPDDPPYEKRKLIQDAYAELIGPIASRNRLQALRKFYAAPNKLYLSQVAIPVIDAAKAPEAFHVADKVKPKYWIAVYQGKLVCPETGHYRFVGWADDVIVVLVNGRLVFDGSLSALTPLQGKPGIEFTGQKGRVFDITILIGEIPGGQFTAWLQIQKDGGTPYWFRMTDKPVELGKNEVSAQGKTMPTSNEQGPPWYPAK